MTSKSLVNSLAITSRRRVIASAVLYGLSLSIRFTSAAGEEVEIAPQSAARAHPILAIMKDDAQPHPYRDWGLKLAQPAFFRYGWPASGGCRAACESPAPASVIPACPAP